MFEKCYNFASIIIVNLNIKSILIVVYLVRIFIRESKLNVVYFTPAQHH